MDKKLFSLPGKTLFISGIFFSLFSVSCEQDQEVDSLSAYDSSFETEYTTNNNFINTNGKHFSYEAIITTPEWLYSEDITWRLSQIQIPEDQLATMPTVELVNLCLDYPFFIDYTATGNCEDGIRLLMSTFNGFQELLKRKDASNFLASYMDTISVPEIVKDTEKNNENIRKSILHVNFVELLLSQVVLSNEYIFKYIGHIENSAQRLYQEKLCFPGVFGEYSLSSSKILCDAIQNAKGVSSAMVISDTCVLVKSPKMIQNSINRTSASGLITLTTTYGLNVVGTQTTEGLTQAEISTMNSLQRIAHPLAILLSSSTSTYNCHSYAWNISESGETCWIEGSIYSQPNLDGSTLSYSDNISAYWSDGLYSSTSYYKAQKIYYNRGDHSAINSSVSGKYESKWGMGPLMRHSPTDCPSIYNPNYRSYYKETSLLLECSAGIREVYINETCSYSAVDLPNGITNTYHWEVINDKNGDDVIGTDAIIQNITSDSAAITFTKRGNYYINLYRVHPNRGNMVYNWAVYVVPEE